MARYPDTFKEQLRDMAPIQDVIHSIIGGVQLSGTNYLTKCPFHEDSTPSLMMKPSTNTWYCNGCGAGSSSHSQATSSDVYGFLKGYYNLNLGQAIEWLAKFLNMPLPALDSKQAYEQSRYQWWVDLCNQSQTRFQTNLMSHIESYRYLRNRGLDDLDIHVWGLGYGDALQQEFANTKGKITFPIHDINGNIISFTGRVPFGTTALQELHEKQKAAGKRLTPKYDHRWPLTESYADAHYVKTHPYPTFDRNQYLYGIYQAKNYIQQSKRVILVEGFTDVIAMHRYGIKNVVASLGTNVSEQQIALLKRCGATRVLLMRDGDEAGLLSMEKNATVLLSHGLLVEVCPLPMGHDPDTLAQTFPLLDDGLSKYIAKRTRTLPQWRVEKIFQENQEEIMYHYSQAGKLQEERLAKVVRILAQEANPIEQDALIRQYAEIFVISYEALQQQVLAATPVKQAT